MTNMYHSLFFMTFHNLGLDNYKTNIKIIGGFRLRSTTKNDQSFFKMDSLCLPSNIDSNDVYKKVAPFLDMVI